MKYAIMRNRRFIIVIILIFSLKSSFLPDASACENNRSNNPVIIRVESQNKKPALDLIIDQSKKNQDQKSNLKNDKLTEVKNPTQFTGSLSNSYTIPYWLGSIELILIDHTHPLSLYYRLAFSSIIENLCFKDPTIQYLIYNWGYLTESEFQYFINVLDVELNSTIQGRHLIHHIMHNL